MKSLHIMDHMDLGGAQLLVKGIFEKYQNPDFFLFTMRKSNIKINVTHPNCYISKSEKTYSFKPLFEIIKLIKKNNIEIIHCYLLKSQIFGWFIKTFIKRKVKLVFHEVGEVIMNDRNIYKKFMSIADKKVNIYFAASNATKEALINKAKAKKEKIIVLYNYIILDNFSPKKITEDLSEIKKKIGIGNNDLILGYAGRLSKEKGCEYIIKALPYLKMPVKLIIAGTGNEKERLLRIVQEQKLDDKVIFMGFVKDIIDFYSLVDIHTIPSIHESFGLIAIEAQSLGKPVIASNIPGLNEVVIDNTTGLLFESKNSQDLAKKITQLFENKNLNNKIIEGGFQNADKYGIDNYYEKMIDAYKNI